MKIEVTNQSETNLKTKIDKTYTEEEMSMFRTFLNNGLFGPTLNCKTLSNDFLINDFISTAQEDIKNLKSVPQSEERFFL